MITFQTHFPQQWLPLSEARGLWVKLPKARAWHAQSETKQNWSLAPETVKRGKKNRTLWQVITDFCTCCHLLTKTPLHRHLGTSEA
jgi:hypothetical protein